MRAVTSPVAQYSAKVGFDPLNRSLSRVSTSDSPMPKILRKREAMRLWVLALRNGSSWVSYISVSSRGGPGSTATILPSFSTTQPGAVPLRLGNTCAPTGK